VEVKIEGKRIFVKGPKGELSFAIRPEVKVEISGGNIIVSPLLDTKQTEAYWGTARAIIANLVNGVVSGYEKRLQVEGIGHKGVLEGNDLVLNVGFTHTVKILAPEGIKLAVEKNILIVSGADKELVSRVAAKIKRVKPPEPYKGKGIRYLGEVVRKKVGKKAVTAGGGK